MSTLSITAAIALMVWSVGGDKRYSNSQFPHKTYHEVHVLMVIGIVSVLILDLHEYNITAIIYLVLTDPWHQYFIVVFHSFHKGFIADSKAHVSVL